jgi:protein phosphatase PTC2/3
MSESGQDERLAYGFSSMQGWRDEMEDAHTAVLSLEKLNSQDPEKKGKFSFFGVYDGHVGKEAADFSAANLHVILAKLDKFKTSEYKEALEEAFLATDEGNPLLKS